MAVMSRPLTKAYIVSSATKNKMKKNKLSAEKWNEIIRQANLLENKKGY